MAKSLTKQDLEHIDEVAAFCAESESNHRLFQIIVRFLNFAKTPGAAAVFTKRIDELKRAKAQDTE